MGGMNGRCERGKVGRVVYSQAVSLKAPAPAEEGCECEV